MMTHDWILSRVHCARKALAPYPHRILVSTVLMLVAVLSGCGDASRSVKGPQVRPGGVIANVAGPRVRGRLLIDERTGSVGSIRLGMAVADLPRFIPKKFYWGSRVAGSAAFYCSRPAGRSCVGAQVVMYAPTAAVRHAGSGLSVRWGLINEIDVVAGVTVAGRIVDGSGVVTRRGIHPGSSVDQVKQRYRIDGSGPGCRFAPPETARMYYSIVGDRTIGFETQRGRVVRIALFAYKKTSEC